MQYKTFLVISLAYLLVADEAAAFWATLAKGALKLIPTIANAFSSKSKKRREINNVFEPYHENLDLELERFLSQLQ
uniref:OcyC3 n=1 Tax=Opisthacanthus cayaporum TaxID=573324 RepID=NDB3T_OPICY|nr:RecName: Full=OcyC3; AltName: Full=Non-disulfide-bridged peptide 4.3; Short=NDBP-4.3; Flags: Precursor [Opisthacanthus cayaporum]